VTVASTTVRASDRKRELGPAAHRRGFQTAPALVIQLVGVLPALYLCATRGPGYASALPFFALFIGVPIALVLGWTLIDAEGRAGRELSMWASSMKKTAQLYGPNHPAAVAFKEAEAGWQSRPMTATLSAVRRAVIPFVYPKQILGMRLRVAFMRFFYPIAWAAVSGTFAAIFLSFLVLTPECGTQDAALSSVCH
jgi:hypothetical protein